MDNNIPPIALREINSDNFHDVVNMKVRDDQKNFVASNVYSIAESKISPELHPFAIYAGDKLVGFAMTGFEKDRQRHWIVRFMIGADYQGKGYGRAAMHKLINYIEAIPGCDRIYLSYEPHNQAAKTLYESLGFVPTGEMEEGEEVACLSLM